MKENFRFQLFNFNLLISKEQLLKHFKFLKKAILKISKYYYFYVFSKNNTCYILW